MRHKSRLRWFPFFMALIVLLDSLGVALPESSKRQP